MSKPPKTSPYEFFEKRLEDLEGEINDLEQHVELLSTVIFQTILIAVEFSMISQSRPLKLEYFDSFIRTLKKTVNTLEKFKKPAPPLDPKAVIDIVINLAKSNEIPFQKLMPYLIEKLGKSLARRIVKKETILRHYGEAAFTTWEMLLSRDS